MLRTSQEKNLLQLSFGAVGDCYSQGFGLSKLGVLNCHLNWFLVSFGAISLDGNSKMFNDKHKYVHLLQKNSNIYTYVLIFTLLHW